MVLLHVYVRNDVVVLQSVFSRAKVPWFVCWVIVTTLEALQFVVEVEHVISLLVSKGSVSVASQHINQILLLRLLNNLLGVRVVVDLSDGVVKKVLRLDKLGGNFMVGSDITLEIALLVYVVCDILFPLGVALG